MSYVFIALFGVVSASIFEWTLHRYIMHRPLCGFVYPYRAHALTHHRIFRSDETYHLKKEEDKRTIPMAWWNGPLLVVIATLPTIPFSVAYTWWISVITAGVFGLYYGAYEYMHWCMHLPKKERRRLIERRWFFYRLNGHHLLHHRYMGKNFNVVLPLADLLFGTLLLRSKVKFAQAIGPSVPDVQPKELRVSS